MTAPDLRRIDSTWRGKPTHHYKLNGIKIDGVTTLLSDGIPKPALLGWGIRSVAEYAADHLDRLVEMQPMGRAAIVAALKESPYQDRDLAAKRGTEVHGYAERLVAGESVDPPEELRGHVESCARFLDDWQVEPVHVETVVAHEDAWYAGTLDLVADVRGGHRVLFDYKGLALDTPIPTPTGWTTMGALSVGDEVFGSDGQPCRVIGKSEVHHKDCYRLAFDDGSAIVADHDHRWVTLSGTASKRARKVLTSEDIARTIRGSNGQRQHRVLNAQPCQTEPADLPIDPYILGLWLGDGTTTCGAITKADSFVYEEVERRGMRVGETKAASNKCPTRTVYGLRTLLRKAGLLGNKHVPGVYMRASIEQRLDLLRGLMDSDGSVNGTRKRVVFSTTNKRLALAVRELVLSLGDRAIVQTVTAHGFGLEVTAYPVEWTPQRFNPFLMPRKRDATVVRATAKSSRRMIVSADRTITVPTQCIEVDSPDSTYLCGDSFIPTHNTSRSGILGETALQLAAYRYAQWHIAPDGSVKPWDQGMDGAAAVWIRGDGYDVKPVDAGEDTFKLFRHVAFCARRFRTLKDLVGATADNPETLWSQP